MIQNRIWVPVLLILSVVLLFCIILHRDYAAHILFMENEIMNATEPARLLEEELNFAEKERHFDFIKMLDFLPYIETGCKDLFKGQSTFDFPDSYEEAEKSFTDHLISLQSEDIEGNSHQMLEEQKVYWRIASLPFIQSICETGFNAGHSTLIWLMVKEDTQVYSFDLGEHDYGHPMAEYLQKKFPGRLHITWGDSTKTLPEFLQNNSSVKCDLVIVDGGHTETIASADLANFREMANEMNLVIIDDYPVNMGSNQCLAPSWEKLKRNGNLTEFFRCKAGKYRGFSIGHYL